MSLPAKQKQVLKAKAHNLRPIVMIGHQGLTKNVLNEINRALNDHELIKIKIHTEDRDLKKSILSEICQTHQAEPIQLIGHIATLYRKNEEEES